MDIDLLLTKYNDEMEVIGHLAPQYRNSEIWNTPITFKENYMNWIRGGKPMFAPMENHCFGFAPACVPDTIARHFVMEAAPQSDYPDAGKDMFGVDWVYEPGANGCMVVPGHPKVPFIEDWADCIELPDVSSWDWEGAAKRNEMMKTDVVARRFWIFTGFFERLISWLDFENAAVALIDEDSEEDVHAALDAITKTYEEIVVRAKKYFDVDIMYVHDDWGSQMAPFFSYDVCEEMIVPYIKRLVDLSHSLGMPYDMHSCGHTGEILTPLMIKAGVDSWRPQPMNNTELMFDKWGDQIRLQVTIEPPRDTQTDQEVADDVLAFLDRYTDPSRGAYATCYFGGRPWLHRKAYAIWYAVSREFYLTH